MPGIALDTEVPAQREIWESWHGRHKADGGWVDADGPLVGDFLRAAPDGELPIIDLGCGQCTSALYDDDYSSMARTIWATDFAETALQLGRRRVPSTRPYPVQFKNADISRGLPFPDRSARGVYAHLSLHYFDALTTRRIFTDILRVCERGAVFGLAVKSVNDQRYGMGLRVEDDLFCLKGHLRHFFSVSDIEELLTPWDVITLCEVQACDPGSSVPSSIITALARKS
jgi:hypothetical protein